MVSAELNRREGVSGSNHLLQARPALDQRPNPPILSVEQQQVEGEEHDPMPIPGNRTAEGIEVGDPGGVLNNSLAVDQRRPTRQGGGGCDDAWILVAPVVA